MATMNDNSENGRSLPDGWEWITVGEIGEVKGGKRLPAGHTYSDEPTNFPYIRVKDFENGTINTSDIKYLLPETQEQIKRYIISTKDVYISIAGTIGVTGVIPEILDGANLTENAAKICNLNSVLPKYLHYYLASSSGQAIISEKTISTNQPKLALFRIEQISVPLAPLPEQEKIVNRIEELFSDLDAGMAALERVLVGLKRYKASVLKAACEGKLFENSEPENDSKLPNGWVWTTIDNLAEEKLIGLDRGRVQQIFEQTPGTFPYIKMNNVTMAGDVNHDSMAYVPASNSEVNKYKVRHGDLLFNTRNSLELVGKTGIVKSPAQDTLFNNNLLRIRTTSDVLPEFLCFQMCSDGFRRKMELVKKSTTNVAAVYAKDLLPLPIALPPLDEQRRIVAEVERRLSVVGEVESAVEVGLVRAGRLRQSVLRSAFEGRL